VTATLPPRTPGCGMTVRSPRGMCAVCRTSRALRRDGTVREHWHDYHRCGGSGWAPVSDRP
jgi:hypothetical protein